jgi:hypothetical protein
MGGLRAADETLNGVLYQVWTEVSLTLPPYRTHAGHIANVYLLEPRLTQFIEGDFHMIRVVISQYNPGSRHCHVRMS